MVKSIKIRKKAKPGEIDWIYELLGWGKWKPKKEE